MTLLIIFYFISILLYPVRCQNENEIIEKSISTSIPGMVQLLETERLLVTALENYAKELKDKAALINRATAAMREENSKSLEDPEEYLSNPLHSLSLIRRMHVDWVHWESYMQKPVGEEQVNEVNRHRIDLPTSTDMNEAKEAIFRLQATYNLQVEDIAAGLLYGKQYNSSLSARDCFELGQSVGKENLNNSHFWLIETFQRFKKNYINAVMDFDILQILELLTESFVRKDMLSYALDVVFMALNLSPNHAKFLEQKSVILNAILSSSDNIKEIYQRCCRGEFDKRYSLLHCRYNSTTHPFLKLAPFKMEEIRLSPYTVIFYDIISDMEIAELKKIALPKLERAQVVNEYGNDSSKSPLRTSKGYFIDDDFNDVTKRIVQRVEDMSGLDMMFSDRMQIINYGLGGHYEYHYDAFDAPQDANFLQGGNRIATLMFYLSDVEQGGATVFPLLEQTVYPRKGSAILWYNLNNRGDKHGGSVHGACPVIVGSKWVMTKWIREKNQLFRRPCYKE